MDQLRDQESVVRAVKIAVTGNRNTTCIYNVSGSTKAPEDVELRVKTMTPLMVRVDRIREERTGWPSSDF